MPALLRPIEMLLADDLLWRAYMDKDLDAPIYEETRNRIAKWLSEGRCVIVRWLPYEIPHWEIKTI